MRRTERLSGPVRVLGLFTGERFVLIIVGLFRSKLAAIFLGPDGVGVIAQAMALQDLLRQTMSLGVGGGFLKMIADAYGTKNYTKVNQVVTAVLGSVLFLSLVAGVVVLIGSGWISLQVFGRSDYADYAIVTVFSSICLVNGNALLTLLQGFQEWRSLTVLNLLQGLISVSVSALLMPSLGIRGALYSFAIAYFLSWCISLIWVRRRLGNVHKWQYKITLPEHSIVKELVQYVGVFASSYIAASMVTLLIRKELIKIGGEATNGQYQVAWVASTTFLGVFGSLLWNYGMPKISSLKNPVEVSRVQNQMAVLLLTLATPLVVVMIITKNWWIPLLFSRQFLIAGDLVTLQLLAGWLELLRHAMNMTTLPQKRFGLYFAQLAFFLGVQLFSGYVMIAFMGATAIPLILAVSGAVALCPLYYYHVHHAGFVPEARSLRMTLGALAALLCVLLADQMVGITVYRVVLWSLSASSLVGVIMLSPLLAQTRALIFNRS